MARRTGRKLACGAALFVSVGFGAVATAAPASAPEGPPSARPEPGPVPVAVDLARLDAAVDAVRLVQATPPPPIPAPPVTEAVAEPAEPMPTPTAPAAPAPARTPAPAPAPAPAPPPPPPPAPASSAEEAIAAWFPEVYDQAVTVARCESGMNPGAVSAGGGNHGLFQINNVHRSSFESVTGRPWAEVYDAGANAQYARYLYDGSGWDPWACQP